MIDPSASLWRGSQSDGSSVDACESDENLRIADNGSTKEHEAINCEVTCRRIPADVAYIEALGQAFHHFTYLEWIVVSITAKLHQDAYASFTKGKTAGY